MSLAAGKLRHRVALQSQLQAQDPATGEITVTWQTQAEVWAAVDPLSAREFVQSAETQAQVTARVTIRYRADVNASWRILHRSKTYNIAGILEDKDSGLEYMTLPVSEGVNDGQ